MRETLFFFGVNDDEFRRELRTALLPHDFRLKYIGEEDYDTPIGTIAGMSDEDLATARDLAVEKTPEAGEITEPLLVFVALTNKRLETALAAMRERKVSIPSKAMLTLTNSAWTPRELFTEIQKERKAIAESQKRDAE